MRKNRYAILGMGTLVFLMLGFLYMWSNFQGAIKADLGFATDASAKWAYTISVVMFSVGITVDGALGKYLTPKKSALIGTLLIASAFLISSVLTPETKFLLYIVYGLFMGLGTGVCYNAWLSNVLPWFGDRRGMASGILLLGMGLTGLTLMKFVVAPWLTMEGLGWRFAFRIIGVAELVIGLMGLLFIAKPGGAATGKKAAQGGIGVELSTGKMLQTGAFWCFTGWKAILFGIGMSVTGAVAGIIKVSAPVADPALDAAAAAVIATNAVAVFSLCNGLSRPLAGIVFDKLKAVKTMAVVALLLTAVSVGLCFVYDHAVTALVVILALVALCYGASTTLGPTYISSVFGQKYYRANHGVQALSAIPFTILGSQGISAVYDATGSYRGFFIIMAAGGVIAFVLAVSCGPAIRKLQKKYSEVRE